MLRTELPHASRVVSPASARRRIACSTSCSLTKWSWKFWRVVMWREAARVRSAASASASSCARVEDALRDLHAQHLRVAGLPLAVGAAHEAERAPLVGRQISPRSKRSSVATKSSISASLAKDSRVRPSVLGSSSCSHERISSSGRPAAPPATAARRARGPAVDRRPTTSPITMVPGSSAGPDGERVRSERVERADPRLRARSCPPRGRSPRASSPLQPRAISTPRDGAPRAEPHEDHDGERCRPERLEHRAIRGFGVARDDDERRCEAAMRDWDPGQRRRGHCAWSARDDLERDARGAQREAFLTAPPEHERVAALEAHHAPTLGRRADHRPVDRRPARADGRPARLPTENVLRAGRERRGPPATRARRGARGRRRRGGARPCNVRSSGSPGPGADQRHEPGHARGLHIGRRASRRAGSASARSSGRRSAIGTPAGALLLAQPARLGDPRFDLVRHDRLQRLPQEPRERGRPSLRRHRDGDAAPPEDAARVGRRALRVVDGVDEHTVRQRGVGDSPVDVGGWPPRRRTTRRRDRSPRTRAAPR